ncbi:hypothetical protein BaRGS_00015457 [Batillaria attramentaria]|uniref:4-aminobutyrate--2-oxoglutarate transaminase n=1 Tax=Batillaria attramentaria TaxID=370345 RepID=A0ABD0L1G8_9CAEN
MVVRQNHQPPLPTVTKSTILTIGFTLLLKDKQIFKGEPLCPKMRTPVPGPMSKRLKEDLGKIQECGAVEFFADYDRSRGNFIFDVDNNLMLDFHNQLGTNPLGYNHPAFTEVLRNPEFQSSFVNRPSLGLFPPRDHVRRLKTTLMSVAPQGLTNVHTFSGGTTAVEFGLKAMFMLYQINKRGSPYPTQEEMASCLRGHKPGTPDLSILSFNNAFHGRTMGALALTHNRWEFKVDLPQPNWPVADFPQMQYPLNEHEIDNIKEEVRCLEMVKNLFETYKKNGSPVAGIVCEPIQSEGGDNYASPIFFQGLQDIAKENGACLMMDEVQTGCGVTGRFWAHEHLYLREPPDVVAFGKKMVIAGIYLRPELRPQQPARIFNTWLGDPAKLALCSAVLEVIEKEKLVNNAHACGVYLLTELENVQKQNPTVLSRVRGLGLLASVDFPTTKIRNMVVERLRELGVNAGISGKYSMRVRPTLTIGRQHVDIFIDTLRHVIKDLRFRRAFDD